MAGWSFGQAKNNTAITDLVKDRLNPEFRINGGFQSNITTNTVAGMDRRLDPFRYRLNGSFRVQGWGWSTGIQLNFANSNRVYGLTLPDIRIPSYAFIGISPAYKSATFHLGYRSMYFSDYTLSGHSFLGVGGEWKPKNFRMAVMYGRLRRASTEDLELRQSLDPIFRRRGWGLKLGYENGTDHIHFILFSAWEDAGTEAFPTDRARFDPADNSIISMVGKKQIGEHLTLELDYALSAFSRNRNNPELANEQGLSQLEKIGGIFQPRLGSTYQKALKTSLHFRLPMGRISMRHERVDPEYRTLGALFFNNDFENITLGTQLAFDENRWMIHSELGFQRNNLNNWETNSLQRLVGSAAITWRTDDRTTLQLNYSNFRTTNKLRTTTIPFIQVDSLTLSLVNQSAGLTVNRISGKDNSQVLTGTVSYQRSNAIENDAVLESQTNANLMAMVSYSRPLGKWRGSTSFILNKNSNAVKDILTVAPTLAWGNQGQHQPWQWQASLSLVRIYLDGKYFDNLLQPRLQLGYQMSKKQSLQMRAFYVYRTEALALQSVSELTTTLSWRVRL